MNLIQKTYMSTLAHGDGRQLAEILDAAVRHNKSHGITGMMLYVDGSIIQTIEGDAPDVEAIYARILADRRHYNVFEVITESLTERKFSEWSMGFRDLPNEVVAALPQYASLFKFTKEEVQLRLREGLALALLSDFGNDGRY